jgi:hypothetical protein
MSNTLYKLVWRPWARPKRRRARKLKRSSTRKIAPAIPPCPSLRRAWLGFILKTPYKVL